MMMSSVSGKAGKDGTVLWSGMMGQITQADFPFPVPAPIESVTASPGEKRTVSVTWCLPKAPPANCYQPPPCAEVRVQLFDAGDRSMPLTFVDAPASQRTVALDLAELEVEGRQLVVGVWAVGEKGGRAGSMAESKPFSLKPPAHLPEAAGVGAASAKADGTNAGRCATM